MRTPVSCICENKGADQLRSNCAADQRLCFRYIDMLVSDLAGNPEERCFFFSDSNIPISYVGNPQDK